LLIINAGMTVVVESLFDCVDLEDVLSLARADNVVREVYLVLLLVLVLFLLGIILEESKNTFTRERSSL
jgi:hypothetical protein